MKQYAILDKGRPTESIVEVIKSLNYFSTVKSDNTEWDTMTNRLTLLKRLTQYPNIGDNIYENNKGFVHYIVDDCYLKDEYPEIITLETIKDYNLNDPWFDKGHLSNRGLEDELYIE